MRHLYYQKFDKNRISPLQRKVLTLKVFTFASEFLKIRIMETKEYFEKVMQDFNQNRRGRNLRPWLIFTKL